jgi:hypothetical protein
MTPEQTAAVQQVGKIVADAREATSTANISTSASNCANAYRDRMIMVGQQYVALCDALGITPEHSIGDFDEPPADHE